MPRFHKKTMNFFHERALARIRAAQQQRWLGTIKTPRKKTLWPFAAGRFKRKAVITVGMEQ